MINPIDRTEEFLAAISAQHTVPNDSQLVKPPEKTPRHDFTVLAVKLTDSISQMREFAKNCQRRYNDYSLRGMTDAERDQVDAAIAQFLRSAMSQIDVLKQEAVEQVTRQKGASFPAHKLGVVVILNEDLQQVSRLSETLRGIRIKQAIAQKSRPKIEYDPVVAREMAAEKRTRDLADGVRADEDADFASMEQQFARENATLLNELVETRERVREAEKTVFEIANLNQVFAAKVLEQAREIEVLYDLAVEATNYVDRGNRELRKMKEQAPLMKYGLAVLLLVLTFAMLFLEWVGRRRWLLV